MKKSVCQVLVLLSGITSALAQQPPRLTLQEALDLADKQNLDLAAARRQRAVVLAGIRIAKERPNPTAKKRTPEVILKLMRMVRPSSSHSEFYAKRHK